MPKKKTSKKPRFCFKSMQTAKAKKELVFLSTILLSLLKIEKKSQSPCFFA
jgi:hypothetical protein